MNLALEAAGHRIVAVADPARPRQLPAGSVVWQRLACQT